MSIRHIDSYTPKGLRYDPVTEIAEVEFTNGFVYQYYDVPKEVYEEFLNAPSRAKFFDEKIRRSYSFGRTHSYA